MKRKTVGWYVTFAALSGAAFAGIYLTTGQDAIGAATRFIWNALALFINGIIRVVGNLAFIVAKGVGLRRVSRLATLLTHVGLGYAGSVILTDTRLKQARGWRGKVKAAITLTRNKWQGLPLIWKLATVAVLIASQLYLHFLLIVFPIAFLVPVVRRLWIQAADLLFGSWYWRTFGPLHRSVVAALKAVPGWRMLAGATRLWRIRYLCAWRVWKYDPRYRIAGSEKRVISITEPARLWWSGALDRYMGRPLLAGGKLGRRSSKVAAADGQASSVGVMPPSTAGASP
jgi:hypothetical protein